MHAKRLSHFCILVDVGSIDIDAVDDQGQTPLIAACYLDGKKSVTLSMIRKLLESGAKINKTDKKGRTVLHHAILKCRLPIVQLLLETAKVKVTIQDVDGNTPLHLAVSSHDSLIVQALVRHALIYQIPTELCNMEGFTPLTLACQLGRVDMARYLSAVVHHSPMRVDHKRRFTGKQWLDVVLFIPYGIDPFNCSLSRLHEIQPKPVNFMDSGTKQFCITYAWRGAINSGLQIFESQPQSVHSLTLRKKTKAVKVSTAPLKEPEESMTVQTITTNKQPFSRSLSAPPSETSRYKGAQPSSLQLVPYFLELQATSANILPSAQPPAIEDTASEIEGMLNEDVLECCPLTKPQDMLSMSLCLPRARKMYAKDKAGKQRVPTMQDLMATSASWSKVTLKKRKSLNNSFQ